MLYEFHTLLSTFKFGAYISGTCPLLFRHGPTNYYNFWLPHPGSCYELAKKNNFFDSDMFRRLAQYVAASHT